VSDIYWGNTRHGYLTANSVSEAKDLARLAVDYITIYGTEDSLFKDYFGATDDATTPLLTFTVCRGSSDGSTPLIPP
jgi:hypothetical protein